MAGATLSVVDREFLPARAQVLAVAATLDRLDRAGVGPDERLDQLRRALEELVSAEPGRAARVQMIFSDAYEEGWRESFRGRSG